MPFFPTQANDKNQKTVFWIFEVLKQFPDFDFEIRSKFWTWQSNPTKSAHWVLSSKSSKKMSLFCYNDFTKYLTFTADIELMRDFFFSVFPQIEVSCEMMRNISELWQKH